jgi:hypothetical protein
VDEQKIHDLALIVVEKCTGNDLQDVKVATNRVLQVYNESVSIIKEAFEKESVYNDNSSFRL